MTMQKFISAEELGRNYANDVKSYVYQPGMSKSDFANAVLENYNRESDAFSTPALSKELENNFKNGAEKSIPFEIENNSGWDVSEKVREVIYDRFAEDYSYVEVRESFEDEDVDGLLWLPVYDIDGEFLGTIDFNGNWQ